MLSSIFISITVNLRDRLWRRSDKVIHRTVSKTDEKTVKIRTTGNEFIFDTSSDDESIVADDSLVSESDFEGF